MGEGLQNVQDVARPSTSRHQAEDPEDFGALRTYGKAAGAQKFIAVDVEGAYYARPGEKNEQFAVEFAAVDIFTDLQKGAGVLLEHLTVKPADRRYKYVKFPHNGRGQRIAAITARDLANAAETDRVLKVLVEGEDLKNLTLALINADSDAAMLRLNFAQVRVYDPSRSEVIILARDRAFLAHLDKPTGDMSPYGDNINTFQFGCWNCNSARRLVWGTTEVMIQPPGDRDKTPQAQFSGAVPPEMHSAQLDANGTGVLVAIDIHIRDAWLDKPAYGEVGEYCARAGDSLEKFRGLVTDEDKAVLENARLPTTRQARLLIARMWRGGDAFRRAYDLDIQRAGGWEQYKEKFKEEVLRHGGQVDPDGVLGRAATGASAADEDMDYEDFGDEEDEDF
jgi:hypothetical protein